jgi:hypothetical protein
MLWKRFCRLDAWLDAYADKAFATRLFKDDELVELVEPMSSR